MAGEVVGTCDRGVLVLLGVASVNTPKTAEMLANKLEREGARLARGVFGARMEVALVNDGPVTIVLDA